MTGDFEFPSILGHLSLCKYVADIVTRSGDGGILFGTIFVAFPRRTPPSPFEVRVSEVGNKNAVKKSIAFYLEKKGFVFMDRQGRPVDRASLATYFGNDSTFDGLVVSCATGSSAVVPFPLSMERKALSTDQPSRATTANSSNENRCLVESGLRIWQESPTSTAFAVINALRAAGVRGMFLSDLTAAVPALRKDPNLIDKLVRMNVISKRAVHPLFEYPRPRTSFRAILCHLTVFALEYEPSADGLQEDPSANADGALALLDAGMDAARFVSSGNLPNFVKVTPLETINSRHQLFEDSNGITLSKLCRFMNIPENTMDAIRSAVNLCSNHSRYRFYEVSGCSHGLRPTASSKEAWLIGLASDDCHIRSVGVDDAISLAVTPSPPLAEQTTFSKERIASPIFAGSAIDGEAILSLPMFEQLLHVVCSANGGLGVTAKEIASSLGISYKRAAKHLKELVSSYGFVQETALVKKAMMIKVLSPNRDVIADGGINIFPSTKWSRSGAAAASSSAPSSAVVAPAAAVTAAEEEGTRTDRAQTPRSKCDKSASSFDRSTGSGAGESSGASGGAPSMPLFQERRLANIMRFIEEMRGVVSIRECQRALQDAQATEGIRTEVDRKTVLRAATLLSAMGKIVVWRVPPHMETGFVNAGKTLLVQTEGGIAQCDFEQALSCFSSRQKELHASRLEAKANNIESDRKRSLYLDIANQTIDDSNRYESRQLKRKRYSVEESKSKLIQLPRDAFDSALERRSPAGVMGVLLGMRPAGIVTSAWQLHFHLCSMLKPPAGYRTSHKLQFSTQDILHSMSIRTAVKLCFLPEDYVHHLAKLLFERKTGNSPDISGFDEAFITGLRNQSSMVHELSSSEFSTSSSGHMFFSHINSRLLFLLAFLAEMGVLVSLESRVSSSAQISFEHEFELLCQPPGTEQSGFDAILSPDSCTKYWESIVVPSLYASIRKQDDGHMSSMLTSIRRDLLEEDFRPSEYDRGLENERLKLQRARARPVSQFIALLSDRAPGPAEVPDPNNQGLHRLQKVDKVGEETDRPHSEEDFYMLELLLRRFLRREEPCVPESIKLNLLSPTGISRDHALAKCLSAASTKSAARNASAERAWGAYLRSFVPHVGADDQAILGVLPSQLITGLNLELAHMDTLSTGSSFWSMLRRKGKAIFKSFRQKYFESTLNDSYRNVTTLLLEMAITREEGQVRPVSASLLRLVNEALDAAKLEARRAQETSAIDDAALTRLLQLCGQRIGHNGPVEMSSNNFGAEPDCFVSSPPSTPDPVSFPEKSLARVHRELFALGMLHHFPAPSGESKERFELSDHFMRALKLDNAESYLVLASCNAVSHNVCLTPTGALALSSSDHFGLPSISNLVAAFQMSKGALSAELRISALTLQEDVDLDQPSYSISVDYCYKNALLCDLIASFEQRTEGGERPAPSQPPPPDATPAGIARDRILEAVTRGQHGGVSLKQLWEEVQKIESSFSIFARDVAFLKEKGSIFLYQRFPFDLEPLNVNLLPIDGFNEGDIVALFKTPNFGPNLSAIVAVHKRFWPLYYHCASLSDGDSLVAPSESLAALRSPWREEPETSLNPIGSTYSNEPSFYHRLSARVLSYLARFPGSTAEAVRCALPCASRMHAAALLDSLVRSHKVRSERQPSVCRLKTPFESPFNRNQEVSWDMLYFIDDL